MSTVEIRRTLAFPVKFVSSAR